MLKKSKWGCLSVAACIMVGSQFAQARTWSEIQQSGELKIGVTGDYSPLTFHNAKGELAGFDIDMMSKLAASLGLKARFVITTWPTLSADLADDKFDLAAGGVTKTKKRAKRFSLSDPVLKNGKIILSNCHNTKALSSLKEIDRPSVKVIVNPGGTNQAYVDQHITSAQIVRTDDNVANLQGIRDNKADVMITDLIEGRYYQAHEKALFVFLPKAS